VLAGGTGTREGNLPCMRRRKLSKDYETQGQMKKTVLGSMNNIAEGFGRFSRKDFIRFLDFAQSSTQEVQSMLYVLEDLGYLALEKINLPRTKADNTKNLTLGFIKYLRIKDQEV
jgi:four helix bundle protein